jgi:hypothetical protein
MARPWAPALVHPAPQLHAAPAPSIEVRLSAGAAGDVPAAGCGGGHAAALDLSTAVLPGRVRQARLERLRQCALAAAEAVAAAAQVAWRAAASRRLDFLAEASPVGGGGGGGAAAEGNLSGPEPETGQFDDVSVLVVLFDAVADGAA